MLVVVAAVAFGAAHAYQGAAGVLLTGVLGGVFAALYLQTGSLLLPVLLHAAVDLRFLLVPTAALPPLGPLVRPGGTRGGTSTTLSDPRSRQRGVRGSGSAPLIDHRSRTRPSPPVSTTSTCTTDQ